MTQPHSLQRYADELERLRQTQNHRTLRTLIHDGAYVEWNGRRLLNLSSNDYLGLSTRSLPPDLPAEAGSEVMGSCSSRLLTGNSRVYTRLEEGLEGLYGRPALVFNSGYHANMGILQALTTERDLILADKLVHASLIDGIRLSAARCVRFPHNDLLFVERLLQRERHRYDSVFLVTESVFSMDGDEAHMEQLVSLKQRYNCLLYVDEAHAIGTHGPRGLGVCEAAGVMNQIDILLGTFGKAVASMGAFAVCHPTLVDYLVNRCRPLIFSTALPPAVIDHARRVMQWFPRLGAERTHLQHISALLRQRICEAGYTTGGSTHIVPLITGNADRAVEISNRLLDAGFFVLPIRRPTVPQGGERIRFSLTAQITEEQIRQLPLTPPV